MTFGNTLSVIKLSQFIVLLSYKNYSKDSAFYEMSKMKWDMIQSGK